MKALNYHQIIDPSAIDMHRPTCRLTASILITSFLAAAVVSKPSKAASDGPEAHNDHPNVIVILTDDQGWGDLSLNGNPNLSTPNIDSLARDGAVLEHFYVCAVCSPTRAEFLTGRYHTRMGVYSTSSGGERFNSDEQTIAELFRKQGYATAAYGKWHSGMQYPYHPNARGFDDFYGFCSGHWGNYFSPMLEHNGRIVSGKGFIVDDLTDHAIDFISQHRDQPFFVYLPLNTPHSPMQVPDSFWSRFKDKTIVPDPVKENAKRQDLVHTRAALAMCENIDANVGRLLRHLEKTGLDDETIFVYFSDNGPNGHRFNAGMRGRKGSTHEGGLRSPCVIRFPRDIKPGTQISQVAAAIDLLPTLGELADVKAETEKKLDGRSIAALLRGEVTDWSDRQLFSAWRGKATVRTQKYRMQSTGQLFDIENDPRETIDLSEQRPKVARKLSDALQDWIRETESTKGGVDRPRPFALAHPDAAVTQLPARDAVPHGKIVHSNKFPNCTYMTGWTNTADEITWDVEVLSEGDFAVQMYYAVPEESVGATVELSIGSSKTTRVIDVANETPLVGKDQDRYPRMEGYVRRWKQIDLGTLHLVPGRDVLRLRATDVPGKEVAEMRMLVIRRL